MVEVLLISSVVVNASMAVKYNTYREAFTVPVGGGMGMALFRKMGGV